MSLARILLLAIALALITTNDAATPVTDPKQRKDPLWMLFARHPGKSERKGEGYPKQDAAVSGFDNDKVTDVGGTTHEGSEALALETNGVLQLARIYGGKIGDTVYKGAGAALKGIFDKMPDVNWRGQPDGAKKMFDKLKEQFITNKKTQFRFETSDLRRASLEAIALRKSFRSAGLGGDRLKNPDEVQSGSGQDQDVRLKSSKFVVLHSMAEIGKLKALGWRSKRSKTDTDSEEFKNVKPDRTSFKFWSYAKKGLPVPVPKTKTMKMQNVKELLLGQMNAIKDEVHSAFSRPDKKDKRKPVPKLYATATATGDATSGAQLMKDWTDGIDLVIATGHGNWYKELVTSKSFGGFAQDSRVANKLKKQLDFTEFVLLKWEIKQDSGNLRIMDGYAPGYKWYDLERVAKEEKLMARSVDYGEYEAFHDDAGYIGFEDYGYDDEDDGEYYGFDDYDDDDVFDEYDREMNEYVIYEKAMKNLMRAKREFTAAKRLVMEDRRMRRKYIYN